MKKRIIIALTLMSLLAGLIPVVQAAEQPERYTAFDVVSGIGLLEEAEEEETVTRARFAAVLYDIACYGQTVQEAKTIFGDRYQDAEFVGEMEDNSMYEDVPASHEYYNKVNFISSIGLMKGVGGRRFEPEEPIQIEHVYKVLVRLLGYEQKALQNGNGITGYLAVANELKLMRGVPSSAAMDGKTFAKIIYNALDVPIARQTTVSSHMTEYTTAKNETLLTEMMGLDKVTGIITENGRTNFMAESRIGKNSIKIGDQIYNLTASSNYISEYIGRYVDLYYVKEGKEKEFDALWAGIAKKDDTETFDITDFISLDGGVLRYEKDGRTMTKRVANGAYTIYNGLAVTALTQELFQHDSGDVTLVSLNGVDADLVIINGYRGGVADGVETVEGAVFDLVGKGSPGKYNIKTPVEEIGKKVRLYDANGKSIALSGISAGMLLDISENGDVKKIIAYTGRDENITVASLGEYDGRTQIITSDGTTYNVAKSFENSGNFNVSLNKIYSAKINRHGEIAYLGQPSAGSWNFGYVKEARKAGGIGTAVGVRMFKTNGKFESIACDDSGTTVYGTDGTERKYKNGSDLYGVLSGYTGLCRYRTNDEGKMTAIELPLPLGSTNTQRDRLRVLYDTKVGGTIISPGGDAGFSGKAYWRAGYSRIIYTPIEAEKEDDYAVLDRRPETPSEGSKQFVAYSINPDTLLCDYFVFTGTNTTQGAITTTGPMIVTSVVTTSDANGDRVQKVTGMRWNRGEETIYFSNDPDIFNTLSNPVNSAPQTSPKVGDIIMTELNNSNIVQRAYILYKADEINPLSTKNQKGWLYGSTGKLERTAGGVPVADGSVQNPYTIADSTGQLQQGSNNSYHAPDRRRFVYGWIYDYNDGIFTITTQNLAEEEYDPNSSIYITEGQMFKNLMMYAHYEDGKVETKKNVALADIKTYKNFGKDCSRLFTATYYGENTWGAILDGYFE